MWRRFRVFPAEKSVGDLWRSASVWQGEFILIAMVLATGQSTPPDGLAAPVREFTWQEPEGAAVPAEHLEQLETCRAGILDPNARPEDRRRWVELLFSYDSVPARALVADLLKSSQRSDVQRSVCEELRQRAREAPQKLDPAYLAPLIDLLGSDNPSIRSAASGVLADFPGTDVSQLMGTIASDPSETLVRRLAAIDALAPNTHRREVVRHLILLLDTGSRDIVEKVIASLHPVAAENPGPLPRDWRRWWERQSAMSTEAWLVEQLQLFRDRARKLSAELDVQREDVRREQTVLITQLQAMQRELIRSLTPEQRQARLVEWLDSPSPVVRVAALRIIRSRIADEGKRPEGELLASLLRLLQDPRGDVFREAVQIVQSLQDAAVVDAVLARLDAERDASRRATLLSCLGKLGSAKPVPLLIREIADPSASPECVREAAIAIGQLSSMPEVVSASREAVAPLRRRYQASRMGDAAMRTSLLQAMAGLADPAFAAEFKDAIESNEAVVLQPALRGLRAVADASAMPRIRALTSHTDPLVRKAAIEAVGSLGRDESDRENLLLRLNPTNEPNEMVRESAWAALAEFMSRRPVPDRVKMASRLKDAPELEARYLRELHDDLSSIPSEAAELPAIRERLISVLLAQGRHAQACRYLRIAFESKLPEGGPGAVQAGVRWLEAALLGGVAADAVDAVNQLDARSLNPDGRALVLTVVARSLEAPASGGSDERVKTLHAQLSRINPSSLEPEWSQLMKRVASREGSDADKTSNGAP